MIDRLRGDAALWLLPLGFLLVYAPLLPELVRDWSRGGDFSHGFLVVPAAAWLAWERRRSLVASPARPYLPGAMLLALGVGVYLLGVAGAEFFLQRASMVAFLGGWILLVWGPERARPLVFPVAFLLFMIPPPSLFWNAVSFPLQLLASRASEGIVSLVGIEAVRAGNVIHLSTCSLEVAHACSGLRSLVTLLATSAVLAEGSLLPGGPRTWISRLLLFVSAIPVAVAVNALRVAGTVAAADRIGPDVASGPVHDASGLVMFAVAIGLLLLLRRVLTWIESSASSLSS